MKGLGSDVTVSARSILLRGFDRQIVSRIEQNMIDKNINIQKGTLPVSIIKDTNSLNVTLKATNGEEYVESGFDTVVLAVGRDFNPSGLGIDKIENIRLSPSRLHIQLVNTKL